MDKSIFFSLTTQIFPVVWRRRKTNTALFSLSAAACRQLALSSLAFSLHNNPSEHLNMALLSLCACPSVCLFVLHTPSFLCDVFKCFLFTLSSQHKYLLATSEQSEMAENVFKWGRFSFVWGEKEFFSFKLKLRGGWNFLKDKQRGEQNGKS